MSTEINELEGTFVIKVKAKRGLTLQLMADLIESRLRAADFSDLEGESVEVKYLYGSVIHRTEDNGPVAQAPLEDAYRKVVDEILGSIMSLQNRTVTPDVLNVAGIMAKAEVYAASETGKFAGLPKVTFKLVEGEGGNCIQVVVTRGGCEVYRK